MCSPSNDVLDDDVNNANEVPLDPKQSSPRPFSLPLSFHERMAKTKFDLQFGKFLKVLKMLYINIPFIDALSQTPFYAMFLKEILGVFGSNNFFAQT